MQSNLFGPRQCGKYNQIEQIQGQRCLFCLAAYLQLRSHTFVGGDGDDDDDGGVGGIITYHLAF